MMNSMFKCKKCNDRKYILVLEKWRPCECLLESRKAHKYHHAGIQPFFVSYTWGDWIKDHRKMSHNYKLSQICVKRAKKRLHIKLMFVLGDALSGKQSFTCLMLKDFIDAGLTARFINLDELIQLEFDKDRREELEYIYNECDMVCVRVGTIKEHSYTRYVLEKFINSRKNNNKYGIITSRLDMETNAGAFGKEVCSMISDGRRAIKIEMRA